MITKPEQANPRHAVWSEITDPSQLGGAKLRDGDTFTAEECAYIATAYAECVGKYINALSPDMEREASDEMDKWQDRFIEWGWMK